MGVRRALVTLASLTVVASGCATPPPDAPPRSASPADLAPEPIAVAGLAGCSALPVRGPGDRGAAGPSGKGDDGRVLPDLDLRCLTSQKEVRLRELGGRPLVINLWATWCGPCREEMPMLEAAHDDLGDQVAFLGVNTRDASTVAGPFLEEVGVSYPQVVDPTAELLRSVRVPGLPVTLFVAPDGEVVDQYVGELDRARLDELVAETMR